MKIKYRRKENRKIGIYIYIVERKQILIRIIEKKNMLI